VIGFVTVRLRAAGVPGDGCPRPGYVPAPGLSGTVSGLSGPVSGLSGPVSGLSGLSGLSLTVRSNGRALLLAASPGRAHGVRPPVDEHFVADTDAASDAASEARAASGADAGSRSARAACADVMTACRPRPEAEALRRLREVVAGHPGAALVALPLAGGGWAVSTRRSAVLLQGGAVPVHPLFPSCLHAWLVAGGSLRELVHADLAAAALRVPYITGRRRPPG
jgi:hypothetical protein